MKSSKQVFKFICMTLVFTIITAFTITPYASANSQPEMSELQVEAQKALKELQEINDIDIKNVKETSVKKEFTLIIDNEESKITYDKQAGELYVDGQLAVTDIVIEEEKEGKAEMTTGISLLASKNHVIGDPNLLKGNWVNTGYLTGQFNVITVTVAAIAGLIAIIFTGNIVISALVSAAAGVLAALVQIDQYQVLWSKYSYKDSKNNKFIHESLNLFNYKGRTAANKICNIAYYWMGP